MGTSKRQHYVPRFYLEYFSSQEGHFWVYDKEGASPRAQTAVNTAVEKYFYRLKSKEGRNSNQLEEFLATRESTAKRILDQWQREEEATLDPRDKEQIVDFLALLHCRVPRNIQMAKELAKAVVIAELKHPAEDPENLRGSWQKFCEDHGQPEGLTFEEMVDTTRNLDSQDKFQIEWGRLIGPCLEFCIFDGPEADFLLPVSS